MGELFPPETLVENAVRAEQAGFDFAAFSDHFHPWLEAQGQSPFTWSVLGAAASRTERIELITMVTCPTLRYHPAIIAQAAATVARLSGGRFTLGLGAGENLNEHVVGHGWPAADVRQDMLEEAVEIIRQLWSGGFQTYRGHYLEVEDARLYTLPDEPVPIAMAAGGEDAAELAGRLADALISTEPEAGYVAAFHGAGGEGKPTYGQVALSWHEDEAEARRQARERWRFALPGWKVMAELPNPVNFDAATQGASEDQIAELVSCGPDPEVHLQAIRKFLDAGYERVAVVQAGPDQEGFLRFWERELAPRLQTTGVR
jgi:G6PDH family F420-dependent oxidoreductase